MYMLVLDSRAIDLSLAIVTQASHQDALCRPADVSMAAGHVMMHKIDAQFEFIPWCTHMCTYPPTAEHRRCLLGSTRTQLKGISG